MSRFLPSKANSLGFLAGLIVLNIIGVIVSTQFNLGHLWRWVWILVLPPA